MHEMNVMNSEAAVDLPVSSKLTGYRGFFSLVGLLILTHWFIFFLDVEP